MTKLPLISSDDVIKKLKAARFDYAPPHRGKGSHVALYKIGGKTETSCLLLFPDVTLSREGHSSQS